MRRIVEIEAEVGKEGERECSNYPPVLQLQHCTAARYPCRLLDGGELAG